MRTALLEQLTFESNEKFYQSIMITSKASIIYGKNLHLKHYPPKKEREYYMKKKSTWKESFYWS